MSFQIAKPLPFSSEVVDSFLRLCYIKVVTYVQKEVVMKMKDALVQRLDAIQFSNKEESGFIKLAIKVIEFLARYGLKLPIRIKPLPDGGVRLVWEFLLLKVHADFLPDTRVVVTAYSRKGKKLIRFEGSVEVGE